MKKMMKICICLIIVFVAVFFGFSIREHFHKNYISNEIFESIDYIYRYEALTRERSGEYEEKIVYTESGFPLWLVDCGDIKVLYDYDAENGTVVEALGFAYAQTTDSSYLFGKKGIRVGMDLDSPTMIRIKSAVFLCFWDYKNRICV
ncbi:MAG: hypothetical protein NC302_01760 [Bacteroidales bacterium]|nr:hypothetical protein [Bacteroidales bacterium]MCM1416806.1 hypothetical protein [bacterium]MCM1422390.1 hypothetical protein [bacterium]